MSQSATEAQWSDNSATSMRLYNVREIQDFFVRMTCFSQEVQTEKTVSWHFLPMKLRNILNRMTISRGGDTVKTTATFMNRRWEYTLNATV